MQLKSWYDNDLSFSPPIYMYVTADQDCSDNSEISSSYPYQLLGRTTVNPPPPPYPLLPTIFLLIFFLITTVLHSPPPYPLLMSTILTIWRCSEPGHQY